jgi:EmrB/QacA subfamily drug resistance transporter
MLPGPRGVQHARPNVILAVLSLAALVYAVLASAVIPALPTIQRSLHASETGVTWLLTGFLLSASVGTAIIGKLGDMYGKQRLLVWTLVTLIAGTLLAALAGSLGVLILARIAQGVAGGIFPLSFSIIRDEFPADRVAGSIGLMSAILGVGGGLGLVVGGLIAEHLSWHWMFWIALPVMVLAAVCTWRYIPESQVRSPGRVNWAAAALMTTGMSCVLIAIAQTTAWGWTSPPTLALLALGLAICGLWILVELRSRNPLVDMTMMRVRGVWTVNLAAFLLGAGLYAWFLLLPQLAQLPRSTGFGYGASVVAAGLYLLPCALVMGVLGSMAGRVERRFGSRRALVAGAAVSAVACGWLAVTSRHPYDMLLCSTLLGVGIGLAFAALGNLIVQAVPAHQTGVASGMNTVLRTLGGALGGQLGGGGFGRGTGDQPHGDVRRREHGGRPADPDGVHHHVRDVSRVPGLLRRRGAAHSRPCAGRCPPAARRHLGAGLGRVSQISSLHGSTRHALASDGVQHLSAVHERVLGLKRVGETVELLEPGVGVVLAVLGVGRDLDDDDVLGHVLPLVGAERRTGDPGADKRAPFLVFAPARQLPFGEKALVLRGLLGTDVDDDDIQFAHGCGSFVAFAGELCAVNPF